MPDLIVTNAGELLTIASPGPRRGREMADLGIIRHGALAAEQGRITYVGPARDVLDLAGPTTAVIDAGGRVVMPGFVDAHTHLIFAGDRAAEFEQRLHGATYLEILARGGGILSTVQATRRADQATLIAESGRRLATMLSCGTTTTEAKTGYGLDLATEMKMLDVAARLNQMQPITIIPTFLAAHAVPPEFGGRADEYVDTIVQDMLPAVARWRMGQSTSVSPAQAEGRGEGALPFPVAFFCDVFCDEGAFTLSQAGQILQAARAVGLGLKIHADEFVALGGARLAAELGAISADHLAITSHEDMECMAAAGVIAVLLPGTTFGLGSGHYADARAMIEHNLAVALGTDLNPGTCYCESMQFIIALACRYLKLTPAEAICAATINAAYASGVGHLVGSLQPGKLADILILDAPDHRHLAYRFATNLVARVIKLGRQVYPG